MNTKSLLLAAVVAAVGAVSGSAQVTSQNIVGYIRLSLNSGFNLISNQLNNGNNAIQTVLPSVPEETTVYKWNGSSFSSVQYNGGWEVPSGQTFTLSPGEGFFIQLQEAATVTLIGEVSLSNTVAVRNGFSLIANPLPLAGRIGDAATVGFVAEEEDTIYRWTGSSYQSAQFNGGVWEHSEGGTAQPQGPSIAIGEGFFIQSSVARNYTRNFSVN